MTRSNTCPAPLIRGSKRYRVLTTESGGKRREYSRLPAAKEAAKKWLKKAAAEFGTSAGLAVMVQSIENPSITWDYTAGTWIKNDSTELTPLSLFKRMKENDKEDF